MAAKRVWVALILAGCTKALEPAPMPALLDAGAPTRINPGKADTALTPEKLEGYLRYQSTLLKLSERAANESPEKAKASLQARALQEERAREESGLTEAELERLDEIVHAVVAKRVALQSSDYDALIEQHEKLLDDLPSESRPSVQRQIEQLKAAREDLTELKAERKQFGSANVDVVLTQEKALTKNWKRMVQVWTAAK